MRPRGVSLTWQGFLLCGRVFPYLVGRENDNGAGGRYVASLSFKIFQDFEPFEVQRSAYRSMPTTSRFFSFSCRALEGAVFFVIAAAAATMIEAVVRLRRCCR